MPSTRQDDAEEPDFTNSSETLRGRATHLSKLLEHYRRRWKLEYLVNLREQHRLSKGRETALEVKEGDVVLVEGERHTKRIFWKLGRVTSLIKGKDDVVRGAKLLLGNGQQLERPLQKLYPLETQIDHEQRNEVIKENDIKVTTPRTKRAAAAVAEQSFKLIDQFENEEEY